MNIEAIRGKIDKGESLSVDEVQQFNHSLHAELADLKQSDPQKYLQLLKQLNESLRSVNSTLNKM
jgi:hypothetical protein